MFIQPYNLSYSEAKPSDLETTFDEVKNKRNWKLGVNRLMFKPGAIKEALIEKAVAHFTGSEVQWSKASGGRVRIMYAGYYASEAACVPNFGV